MSSFSPPQRPAPRGPKALRKLFLPLPHSDRGGQWLSSPPSPAPFPRRQRTWFHRRRKGPQGTHPVRPHPGSPGDPGCPSAGRRFQQMVSAGEWTGVPWGNTGSRILAALGTRGCTQGILSPGTPPHTHRALTQLLTKRASVRQAGHPPGPQASPRATIRPISQRQRVSSPRSPSKKVPQKCEPNSFGCCPSGSASLPPSLPAGRELNS